MGWPVASKDVFPVVLASKPPDHKGRNPFLVGTLGAQDRPGSPSRQFWIEDLGDGRALKGSPEQDSDQPHESDEIEIGFIH